MGGFAARNTTSKQWDSAKRQGPFPFVDSTKCSLQEERASPRMTLQPLSAPPSLQFAAAQQGAPKITFIFQNWKMAPNHPKGENDNGMSSARAPELTLPARDGKLELHGKRLNGTGSRERARNRGHQWPSPVERITHPLVSPLLEAARGLCHGSAATNASALQACAHNCLEHAR